VEPVNPGSNVADMKPGDYLLHVHIQYAKNVSLPGEDVVDPFVSVSMLGQRKITSTKENITPDSKTKYDEHIFMVFRDLTKDVVSESQIEFRVENKGFFRGDTIGVFTLATSKVYYRDNHLMEHQIIALNNPDSDDFSLVTGYLIVNINVLAQGDEASELKMGTDQDFSLRKPLMPSSVQIKYKQLYLRLLRAENLPIMDKAWFSSGSTDAYAVLHYG